MKTFYSAEDIQALAAAGRKELRIDANVVLTDLARDEARRLGITLIRASSSPASHKEPQRASPRPAPLGSKPRGCQHGPIVRAAKPADSDPVVDELVSLVKRLGREE